MDVNETMTLNYDDNYFLAGMQSLLNNDKTIRKNIMTQTYNATAGIFGAKVYIRGIPTIITVDDYLPVWGNTQNLVFATQAKNGALWAPFMEKVWAKVNGNYEQINSGPYGNPVEAHNFLLGVPCEFVMV
jgi:Calpain family cysteine protease